MMFHGTRMGPKDAGGMAVGLDSDQTASGCALFVQTYLYKYFGLLLYFVSLNASNVGKFTCVLECCLLSFMHNLH